MAACLPASHASAFISGVFFVMCDLHVLDSRSEFPAARVSYSLPGCLSLHRSLLTSHLRCSIILFLDESRLPSAHELAKGDDVEVTLPVLGLAHCDLSLGLASECGL